jgi:hypothetical protein
MQCLTDLGIKRTSEWQSPAAAFLTTTALGEDVLKAK